LPFINSKNANEKRILSRENILRIKLSYVGYETERKHTLVKLTN